MRETTSLGAAIAAGFAVDIWKEFDELKEIVRPSPPSNSVQVLPLSVARKGESLELERRAVHSEIILTTMSN